MRETKGSLAAYLILLGLIGLPSALLSLIQLETIPNIGIVNAVAGVLSVLLLFSGVFIKKSLEKPQLLLALLFIDGGWLLLSIGYKLAEDFPVSFFWGGVELLITIYLIYSVKRLSKEHNEEKADQA